MTKNKRHRSMFHFNPLTCFSGWETSATSGYVSYLDSNMKVKTAYVKVTADINI